MILLRGLVAMLLGAGASPPPAVARDENADADAADDSDPRPPTARSRGPPTHRRARRSSSPDGEARPTGHLFHPTTTPVPSDRDPG